MVYRTLYATVTGHCSGVKERIGGHMAGDTPKTRPRGFLSRELIIKEALALLEEHGPGALSMRRLADRLGVAPNALYTHVRGKAALIDGLVDQVYAGLDLDPDLSGDWTEQLATLSQAIRAHLLAHPAVVPFALPDPGPRPGRGLDRAARHAQPGHPPPPARPPRRGPLRPPTARPRPARPAPGRGDLHHPATRGLLRPGRRRHRPRAADLHPGVRRPGDPPGDPPRRHHPADQRRARAPYVGVLRRPAAGRVPPPRPARPAAGPQLHRRPVPVRHPDLPRRPQRPATRTHVIGSSGRRRRGRAGRTREGGGCCG